MSQTPTNPLAALSDAIAAQVQAAAPLVVGVAHRQGRALSGILWRDDLVVTSEQALPNRRELVVTLPGEQERAGKLVGRDATTNVALLRLDTPGQAALPDFAPAPLAGELALAIGVGPAVRLAAIRHVGPAWRSMAGGQIDRLLVLDMPASRREEGGPVMDSRGRLLGMATAGPRGRALVIPHETIARAIETLLAAGAPRPRGWLGVGLQPVEIPAALAQAAGQASGLMVVGMAAGGPAEAAGILPGDILLAMGGEKLAHPAAIRAMLAPDRVGQSVPVRLLRGGAAITLTLTITARPETAAAAAG
jgi:S1-C subfamily serine protease